MESLKSKITSNFLWRIAERFGAQGVTAVVSIVLARLIDPEVYGTIALVSVFTAILQVFVDSGFGSALIQKKDADDLDFSSVFWFNISFCAILYCLLFWAAPLISEFYGNEELTPLVRVIGLTIILSGVKNIQQSYVSKKLQFKKFFFATLCGTIGAAFVGIYMARRGLGVWALVAQSLFNNAVDTVILWITVDWHPRFIFSFERLKTLFAFGWKILLSSLIDTIYNNVRSLIIGKRYTSADLAFYNKGKTFPNSLVTNINTSIDSVLLPTMSAEQDDPNTVKSMTRRAIKTSTYLMMPLMMGIAVCAEPLVRLLLTEKWLPTVFFLRIFCFTFAFYPIHTANLNAIKALGRSDLFLKLEIIKKIVGIVAIAITMFISVEAMAISLLVTTILSQIINSWPNRKLLNYSYIDQVKDMMPQIIQSCIMGAIVYPIVFLKLNDFFTLVLQVITGGAVYLGLSYFLKNDSFEYCLNTAKLFLSRNKHKADNKLEK